MEQLFVYAVIMMIIALFGYVRKMQEEREARKRQEQKPIDPADLPPETRRQLYGDQGHTVREARPAQKQSKPQAVPPPVRRAQAAPAKRQAAPVSQRSEPRVPAAKQAQGQAPSQRTAPAPPTFDRMRRALEQMAESIQEQAQKAEGRPKVPPAVPQRPAVAPGQVRKSAEQLANEQARRQAQLRGQHGAIKTTARQVSTVPSAPKPRPRRQQTRLFSNLSDVRRGIVINEVLGPPKGLQ
jgi:hypothetical protein